MGKVYAILHDIPGQQPAIKRYCFGSCGKIIVGHVHLPVAGGYLGALVCREDACPALNRQMDEAMGSLQETGELIYLRKLREEDAHGRDKSPATEG